MATKTGELFTGMHVGNRSHRVNRHPFFIQQLKVDGFLYGGFTIDAAVFFDRHYSQRHACKGFGCKADSGFVFVGCHLWEDLNDSHPFYLYRIRKRRIGYANIVDAYCGRLVVGHAASFALPGFRGHLRIGSGFYRYRVYRTEVLGG